MIEVRIDFDEIDNIRELNYAYGNRIPENIKEKMLYLLSLKLNLPPTHNWDTFKEFYQYLHFKELQEFKPEDGWASYDEFLMIKEEDNKCGIKNKQGVRDNLKLIFINFNKFYKEHNELANKLLNFISDVKSEMLNYYDKNNNDFLNITIVIES